MLGYEQESSKSEHLYQYYNPNQRITFQIEKYSLIENVRSWKKGVDLHVYNDFADAMCSKRLQSKNK